MSRMDHGENMELVTERLILREFRESDWRDIMRLEGRLRDKEYFKERWWDTLLYAILEEEWREQQQNRKREPASPSPDQAGRHVGRSTPEDPGRLSDKERYSTMNDKTHPRANARHPAASRPRTAPYTASDLPIDEEGRIYHLQLKPGQIAPDILIVGDPGRAEFIASTFFSDLEFEHEHRGLVTVTGTSDLTGEPATIVSPLKTTVATSGIGTSSL